MSVCIAYIHCPLDTCCFKCSNGLVYIIVDQSLQTSQRHLLSGILDVNNAIFGYTCSWGWVLHLHHSRDHGIPELSTVASQLNTYDIGIIHGLTKYRLGTPQGRVSRAIANG